MRLFGAVCFAALLLASAGCASHRQVIATKEGTATVETNQSNDTTTITSKEGSASFGKNAVDVSKIGLPIYPGATANDTGGMSFQSKEGSSQIVVMTTADSFDKVYAWYKGQMPSGSEQMHMSSGNSSVASFVIGKQGDKNAKTVTITADKDKTSIMLAAGSKSQ